MIWDSHPCLWFPSHLNRVQLGLQYINASLHACTSYTHQPSLDPICLHTVVHSLSIHTNECAHVAKESASMYLVSLITLLNIPHTIFVTCYSLLLFLIHACCFLVFNSASYLVECRHLLRMWNSTSRVSYLEV